MSMTKRGVTSTIVMNVIERRRKTHSSLDITDSRGRDGNELQYELITCKNNALSAPARFLRMRTLSAKRSALVTVSDTADRPAPARCASLHPTSCFVSLYGRWLMNAIQ